MTGIALKSDAFVRLLTSLTESALRHDCGMPIHCRGDADWLKSATLGSDGLDLDEHCLRMAARRAVIFFNLAPSCIDTLTELATLKDWADYIENHLGGRVSSLTFMTVTASGRLVSHTHAASALAQDAEAISHILLEPFDSVVSAAPVHTLFGFLTGILLPQLARVPVTDIGAAGYVPGETSVSERPLIAAAPINWHHILAANPNILASASALAGLSATPPDLALRIRSAGVKRLYEIYGSRDASMIGWRLDGAAPFRLFAFWAKTADGYLQRMDPYGVGHGQSVPPGLFLWELPAREDRGRVRRFRPVECGIVSENRVADILPKRIAEAISQHDLVAQCSVHLVPNGYGDQVKAHIVLKEHLDPNESIVRSIESWCRRKLPPAARPRLICFGTDIPQDAEFTAAQPLAVSA